MHHDTRALLILLNKFVIIVNPIQPLSNLTPHLLSPSQHLGITPRTTQIGPQLLFPNLDLLSILQHEKHPRPLRARSVPPPMIRAPLHRHIAPLHQSLDPIIKYHLHLSLENDAIIERLRTMHQGPRARTEIDNARNGAVRVDESQLLGLDDLVVGGDVGVAVHVGREGGGGVDDVEGHGAVDPGGPGAGAVGFDYGLARGVVAGDVVGESREAVGELGVVAGSNGVGHGDDLEGWFLVRGCGSFSFGPQWWW